MRRHLHESRRRSRVSPAPAARGITRRGMLAAVAAVPAASPLAAHGFFAGAAARLRVGVVGCGGRGTGAAMLAAAADPAVRVVSLGDLFTDQLGSAAARLHAAIGPRFDCPAERRFAGADAWRHVIDGDVDLVILAGPPDVRPLHLEAAVAAGRHVYCEKPVAVDLAGVTRAAAAAERARIAGLAIGSGLCFRHDPRTAELAARVHGGLVGPVTAVQMHASLGLPWRKAAAADGRDWRVRNWISFAAHSGGHLVEHHVEAIDRGLWMLGDATPVMVEGSLGTPGPGADAIGDCPALTFARYHFADGRVLEASIERAAGADWSRVETVTGGRGTCDLLAGTVSGRRIELPQAGPLRFGVALGRLVHGILSGRPVHEAAGLCHGTRAAVLGRMAAESGRPVAWSTAAGTASVPA